MNNEYNFYFKKKKKKKINNLNQSYKKEQTIHQKKVERQNTNSFCVERYGLNGRNDIKFIQNKKIGRAHV